MITTVRRPAPPQHRTADWPVASLVGDRRPRRRRGRGALVAVVVLLAAVVALILIRPGNNADDSSGALIRQRAEFLAYRAALEPLAKDGGRVVQQGLKATVVELFATRDLAPDVATRAEGQLLELQGIRDRVVASKAPPFLKTTKALYDHSLRDYVATARILVAASHATGDARAALVRLAIDMGEETDDLYEQADDAMDRVRVRLGLPSEEEPTQ